MPNRQISEVCSVVTPSARSSFDKAGAEQRGDVEILWHPVGEHILDELAHRLLDAVRTRGVKRLVIDGISGFQQAALEPERIVRFWGRNSWERTSACR